LQAQIDEANAAFGRTTAAIVGARVDQRIEGGDVAPTICEVARELGVDAIIVGSHALAASADSSSAQSANMSFGTLHAQYSSCPLT
jgi:nucleotide-binding universal stress UspA family protein